MPFGQNLNLKNKKPRWRPAKSPCRWGQGLTEKLESALKGVRSGRRHLLDVLGQRELVGVVVAAGLAEDLAELAVLPLEDVAGGLTLQADEILGARHGWPPFETSSAREDSSRKR